MNVKESLAPTVRNLREASDGMAAPVRTSEADMDFVSEVLNSSEEFVLAARIAADPGHEMREGEAPSDPEGIVRAARDNLSEAASRLEGLGEESAGRLTPEFFKNVREASEEVLRGVRSLVRA